MNQSQLKIAFDALDAGAEQVRFLLALDPTSSQCLVNEIIGEKNILPKLSKFIHLVVDRLKFQNITKQAKNEFDNFLTEVKDINKTAPDNPLEFISWMKQYLIDTKHAEAQNKENINKITSRLTKCQESMKSAQETLVELQSTHVPKTTLIKVEEKNQILNERIVQLSEENKNFKETKEKNRSLRHENKNLVRQIKDLSMKAEDYGDHIQHLQRKISEMNEITKGLPEVDELKRMNIRLKHESIETFNSKSREIAALKDENEKLRDKINKLNERIKGKRREIHEAQDKVDHYDEMIESTKTIRMKLQNNTKAKQFLHDIKVLPCECFNLNEDWISNHISLHESIADLQNKNKYLTDQLDQVKNKNHDQKRQISTETDKIYQLTKKIHELEVELAQISADRDRLQKNFDKLTKMKNEQENEISRLRISVKDNSELARDLERTTNELNRIRSKNETLVNKCKNLQHDVTDIQIKKVKRQQDINTDSSKPKSCTGVDVDVDALRKKYNVLENEIDELQADLRHSNS